jgi:ankyrin repeat protein
MNHTEVVEALAGAGSDVNVMCVDSDDEDEDEDNDDEGNDGIDGVAAPDVPAAAMGRTRRCHGASLRRGKSPLMIAAINGRLPIVKALLTARADVNQQNQWGWTALHYAADRDDGDMVRVLAAVRGADIELRSINLQGCGVTAGGTPLYIAAKDGHVSAVQAMVEAEADIEFRDDWLDTPLLAAVLAGHRTVVEALIAAGADINARNMRNETAFIAAARLSQLASAQTLLAARAEVDARDGPGWTALMHAVRNSPAELVTLLRRPQCQGQGWQECDCLLLLRWCDRGAPCTAGARA